MVMTPPGMGSKGSVSKKDESHSTSRPCIHEGTRCVIGDLNPTASHCRSRAFIAGSRRSNRARDSKSRPSWRQPCRATSKPASRTSRSRESGTS